MESKVSFPDNPPPYSPPESSVYPITAQYPHPLQYTPSAPTYPPTAGPAALGYTPHPTHPLPTQYLPAVQPHPAATGTAADGQPHGDGNSPAGHLQQGAIQDVRSSPPPQSRQKPQVAIVSSAQNQSVPVQRVSSYVLHIVFACLVLLLCNMLFGLISFILAGWLTSRLLRLTFVKII